MIRNNIFAGVAVFAASMLTPVLFEGSLIAAGPAPTASTVPFVASNPTSPHQSWSGNAVTLKGTMNSSALGTDTFTWDWDPGDGGAHCTGTITPAYTLTENPTNNPLILACKHTYAGSVGAVFTAVLNVTDTTNAQVAPSVNCPPGSTKGACYYTALFPPPPNLPIEVNNAIDNGLWFLHTVMNRVKTASNTPIGNWYICDGNAADACFAGDTGPSSLDCTAFEVSGFLTTNSPTNPYSDDVARCVAGVFDQLSTIGVGNVNTTDLGSFNADKNGNGIGVGHNGGDVNYQTGMMLDSIIAAGTPALPVPAGTLLASQTVGLGSGPGKSYLFKDAVFDMVDDYSYCMNIGFVPFYPSGGWHYTCQEVQGDNSVSQWAAIGIIPARRQLSAPIDPVVGKSDAQWLDASFFRQSANNGYFGYTSSSPIWGPYADTPSGLVQLAMVGLGRGTTSPGGNNLWDASETFIRDNFGNPQSSGAGNSLKDYYYGMFSFTKAMLLHDNSGTGTGSSPITLLRSMDDPGTCKAPGVPVFAPGSGAGPCYPPIDWYNAQTAAFGGTDPTDGVARTILGNQNTTNGSWFGQNYVGQQNYFQTAVSVIMLNKTVFQAVPVACFTTNPTHVASGGPVTLDGGCSVEQNPAFQLVSWQWDVSGTGGTTFTIGPGSPQCLTASCSKFIYNFTLPPGKSLPYSYPVRLRVTDNAIPALTADVVGNVIIAAPPNPPNANAGGPYNFCPNSANGKLIYAPFLLDGSKSTNPDQGQTDGTPGAPPSTITAYDWDYSCSGSFTSAHTVQVDATAAFAVPADFGTSFNACLRVTNNDNLAFPTAGLGAGLSSVASTQVAIHNPTDEVCTHCVQTLGGNPKAPTPTVPANIQLYWNDTNTSPQFTIDHYNIYRSLNANFMPFTQIAGAASTPFIPAVKVSNPAGGKLFFLDNNVVGGTTYYYRIAPATVNDTETCQGNVILTVALAKGR